MKKLAFLLFCFSSLNAVAQVNNRVFEQRMVINESDSGKLFLGINFLGFGKNNEWFDTTVDGYTLLGYQLNPYLSYNLARNVRLDAGVYAQKDIGNDEYSQVAPTLSLKIKKRNFNFILGTLESSLNHRLIEPLYDFERVLNQRLENGVQVLLMSDDLFLDVWVDWQNMIYLHDSQPEKFVFGISLNKTLLKKGKYRVDLPVQILAGHQGGQIDVGNEVITRSNVAVGLALESSLTGFFQRWGIKAYGAGSTSSSEGAPFQDGNGILINPYIETKIGLTVMGSYWKGDEFLSIQGGQLYPSVPADYPNRVDQIREIYMLRFLYDVKVANGLTFTARAEPFYDTYSGTLEYSYGLYLNFSDRFFLVNAKKK